jgi:hypothetical protein
MQLLDLPLDVVQLIIEATVPESIENLALTCWPIYTASDSALQRYNVLYRPFKNLNPSGYRDEGACIRLVHRIAHDHLVARSIVSAHLVRADDPVDDCQDDTSLSLRAIQSLFEKSWYLRRAGIDPTDFLNTWRVASWRPYRYIFLFTLLPNIVELSLPFIWDLVVNRSTGQAENAWKLLNAIVERANDPTEPSAGLSKLTTINPSESSVYIHTYLPFLSIRSVRNVHLFSCQNPGDHERDLFKPAHYPDLGQHLEVIEMAASDICGDYMRELLHQASNLRCFRYNQQSHPRLSEKSWDAEDFLAAVEETTFENLEELSISHGDPPGLNGSAIRCMKKFKKLSKIELDVRLLLGSFPPSQPIPQSSQVVPMQYHNDKTGTPKLTSLLPRSTESFVLLTNLQEEHVDATDQLFTDLACEAWAKLPLLRNITIKCSLNGSTYGGPDCAGRDPDDCRWQRIEKALWAVDGKIIEYDGDVQAEFMTTWEKRFGTNITESILDLRLEQED